MKIAVLLFLAFPALTLGGFCQLYHETFECKGVDQDEFLSEVIRHRDEITSNVYTTSTIIISDSDFATIQKLPDLKKFVTMMYPQYITIRNSSVTHISDGAFSYMNELTTLDLSDNHLKNLDFASSLPPFTNKLSVSNNELEEVNLALVNDNLYNLNVSGNGISVIRPSNVSLNLENLDLSYNQLSEFNETYLGISTQFLNLSHNNPLQNIEITNTKRVLTLKGNNITINSNADLSIDSVSSSFIPKNKMVIKYDFDVTNTFLGSLSEENPLNVISYHPIGVGFSNCSLSNISEYYFSPRSGNVLEISELNLSHNNLSTLQQPLFRSTKVGNLDLSFSRIKTITPNVISNIFGRNSLRTLNLRGNLLEDLVNICPDVPSSENILGTVDLSLNKFKKFDIDSLAHCTSLEHLNLSECTLNSANFFGANLVTLDLSKNEIVHVGSNNFSSMSELVTLKLNGNKIRTVDSYSFSDMSSLQSLDLSDNLIENIEENAFSKLTSIVTIDLANNQLKILKSDVFVSSSVENILLQGNNIRFIESRAFDNLYKLRTLNLSNIGLTILEKDAFYNLKSLHSLDLSENSLILLDDYTFRDLPLTYLNLSGNEIEEIHSGAFSNLSNLLSLNLSDQKINRLHPHAFSQMELQSVDLRNNPISEIPSEAFSDVEISNLYLDGISGPVHLDDTVIVTNLSLQFDGAFEEKTIQSLYLKNLYLENSRIDLLRNNSFHTYGLQQLHLINSTFGGYESNALSGLFSLSHLDASPILKNATVIRSTLFQDLSSLQVLKIPDTIISQIEDGAFSGLTSLQELHLDGNNITSINETTLRPIRSSLRTLNISRNSFSTFNLSTVTNSLPQLRTLNVSSSHITRLVDSDAYTDTNSLEDLFLSGNYISGLNADTFKYFTNYETFLRTNKLRSLRLDSNQLESLGSGVFEGIEDLEVLDISHNPKLFKDPFSIDGVFLLSFKNLISLNLDETNLGNDFVYNDLKMKFPRLQWIGINNNQFSCTTLSKLLQYLDDSEIDYIPNYPRLDIMNLNGIVCYRN